MSKLTFVVAVTAGLAAGCFEAPKPNCAFLCGTDSSCPSGYTCAGDGWCKRADLPATFACETGLDAAVADAPDLDAPDVDAAEIDAPDVDAPVDAPTDAAIDAPDAAVPILEIITASPLAFGDVPESQSATRPVTVRNSGGAATSALTVDVTGAGFARVGAGDTCTGATLPALGMCSFDARFTAGAVGDVTGLASVSATAGGAVSINLTASSVAMLAPSPTALAFGDVAAAATPELTVIFTNRGTVATAVLNPTLTGDPRFTIVNDNCSGTSVAAAGMCAVIVRFTASSAGAATGTLAIADTPGGPVSLALTATGL